MTAFHQAKGENPLAKRYQEIVDYIKEKIDSTAWPVGYKLPREVDLCTEFDVSRTTIRRALSVLVADGHLQRVKGTAPSLPSPRSSRTHPFLLRALPKSCASAAERGDRGA